MGAAAVTAAQSGDARALDELISDCLPLVYNLAGRALGGHADVDDVVQETMLRVVDRLNTLRDPESFRPWLISITLRQIQQRWRGWQNSSTQGGLGPGTELADRGADF